MIIKHTSDLHLEFGKFPDFSKEPGGDVLILNGDILVAAYLNPKRTDADALFVQQYLEEHFIPQLLNKFAYVLYLAGNHEHYRYDINESLDTIYDWFFIEQGVKNMVFMENDIADIVGVRFIGATLWSDFLGEDPVAIMEAGRGMNDFRIIMNGKDRFRPEDALAKHRESVKFIQEQSNVAMPVVVVTHHAPTSQMLNRFHSGGLLDGAYYTDLSKVMEDRPNIKYWISGHTHHIGQVQIHNTMCVSNCRGYPHEVVFKQWTGLNTLEI